MVENNGDIYEFEFEFGKLQLRTGAPDDIVPN
jgi:hypothetical protein